MKASREMLEDRLENYEEELKGARSYVKELMTVTATLGTPEEQFEEDLREAEHNISFYAGEIAEIKKELGGLAKSGPTQPKAGTILPQTSKQGISPLIFCAIGFVAGAVLGSMLKSRKGR